VEIALTEIDKIPLVDDVDDSFIGFVNEKEETIQFVRFEENAWVIDVPIFEKGIFSYSLGDDHLTTEKVKDIVKKFSAGEDWKSSLNLTRLEHTHE
jgi:hypothetical protein